LGKRVRIQGVAVGPTGRARKEKFGRVQMIIVYGQVCYWDDGKAERGKREKKKKKKKEMVSDESSSARIRSLREASSFLQSISREEAERGVLSARGPRLS